MIMKRITIAFDIDGTLRCNCTETCRDVNMRILHLAEILAHMKNVRLIAWSGGGKDYAQRFIYADTTGVLFNLFGERCYSKLDGPHVDIAIDDIQDCELGDINLIVREK